jgi:hypothetical protein
LCSEGNEGGGRERDQPMKGSRACDRQRARAANWQHAILLGRRGDREMAEGGSEQGQPREQQEQHPRGAGSSSMGRCSRRPEVDKRKSADTG